MTDQSIIFKNSKTGKVEQISSNDMELVNFQRFVGNWGLRIFLKNGILHRFGGFKDGVSPKHYLTTIVKIRVTTENDNLLSSYVAQILTICTVNFSAMHTNLYSKVHYFMYITPYILCNIYPPSFMSRSKKR